MDYVTLRLRRAYALRRGRAAAYGYARPGRAAARARARYARARARYARALARAGTAYAYRLRAYPGFTA